MLREVHPLDGRATGDTLVDRVGKSAIALTNAMLRP